MNFWTRFGWSLLSFGAIALVASFFGYAPRKLAHLSPDQIKAASGVLMAAGAVCLALGGDPRTRRRALIALGSIVGLAVLALAGLFVIGYAGTKRRLQPPPPPPPAAGWTATAPAAGASPPSGRAPPASGAMTVLHQKREAWTARFGRRRVWSVIVHLRRAEPPPNFEARLRELVAGKDGGEIAVARMSGMVQAGLAPCDDAVALKAALEDLFPGSRVQVMDEARRAAVFPRDPLAPQ